MCGSFLHKPLFMSISKLCVCVLLLCKFWSVKCQKLCQKDTLVCMYLVSLDYPGWQIKSTHDTRRVAGSLNPKPKVDLKLTTGPTAMAEGSYGSFRPWRAILHSRWATCARPTSPVLVAKFVPHVHNLSQRSHRCIWQPLWWSRGSRVSGNLIGAEERTPGKKLDGARISMYPCEQRESSNILEGR